MIRPLSRLLVDPQTFRRHVPSIPQCDLPLALSAVCAVPCQRPDGELQPGASNAALSWRACHAECTEESQQERQATGHHARIGDCAAAK